MNESLLISSQGRLRRLTLNRPGKRNALDVALCRSLVEAIGEAASDPAVGAILLDAKGKDFCSGMDLTEALETNPDDDFAKDIRAELTSASERYATYTRKYLGWGVFALMSR